MKDLELINQLPGYIGWKDCDSNHLGCNTNLAKILNFKKTTDIIGLHDRDIPSYSEETSTFHAHNDKLVLAGKTIKALHKPSSPYKGEVFYFIKKPLLNAENKICGLIYHCQEFDLTDTIFHQVKMNLAYEISSANYYYINPIQNHFNLSQRELECLFLTLREKNAREISLVMEVSKRTVESYLENIKNKFGSNTKTNLIITAVTNGYLNYLPSRFIKNS